MGVIGTVVAVGTAVVAGVAAAKSLFGGSSGSHHSSGPSRTYEKQKRWDDKREKLQNKIQSLESKRDEYSMDSNRFNEVQQRKESLETRIQTKEASLVSAQQKQREIEASLNECMKSDAVNAVQILWEKEGNNAVDQIVENCPRLDELTSDMADMHNKVVEEQTQEGFALLRKYRDEQIEEKVAKVKDHQQAEAARLKLCAIIRDLEKLQMEVR